ncbi:MAG TPA: prepilin-type N-terminal cleavage/methylation domain-containing protein, partial [Bdellovibrionales bacterium]|nr:prepilin-type N-terminal cleavage/methylation domain-containing protein [Bdellovibrionales bacterium]
MRNESGFTLIEVIVALVILAMLSLLTAQAIQTAIQNRSFITADIERDAELSDAMRIIRNDVNSAFHHRDIFIALENEAIKPKKKDDKKPKDENKDGFDDETGEKIPPENPEQPPANPDEQKDPGPQPSPRPSPPVVTGFIGDASSMYFTTLSNVRTLKDSKESDQAKIGYFVKPCRSRDPGKNTRSEGKCLYRSISPMLDKEIDKPGEETVLLENVQDFKL